MKFTLAAFFLIVSLLASPAYSTDVKFGEEWLYRVSGRTLKIIGGDLYNYSPYASGDLQISLWALPRPFKGTSQRGYRMGYVNMPALAGNSYRLNIVKRTRYTKPRRGSWYRSFILCEWDEGGCYARSWLNWPTRKRFYGTASVTSAIKGKTPVK